MSMLIRLTADNDYYTCTVCGCRIANPLDIEPPSHCDKPARETLWIMDTLTQNSHEKT